MESRISSRSDFGRAPPGARPKSDRLLAQPFFAVFADEGIVIQVRVGGVDAVDLGGLARGKRFLGIQAPGAGKQSLATQDLVNAGNTAGKGVGGIEERGIAVGDGGGAGEEFLGHRQVFGRKAMAFVEKRDGLSAHDARDRITHFDRASFDYVQDQYRVHPGDNQLYDLVINTAKIPIPAAADLIIQSVKLLPAQ